jgi:hypothetical protein
MLPRAAQAFQPGSRRAQERGPRSGGDLGELVHRRLGRTRQCQRQVLVRLRRSPRCLRHRARPTAVPRYRPAPGSVFLRDIDGAVSSASEPSTPTSRSPRRAAGDGERQRDDRVRHPGKPPSPSRRLGVAPAILPAPGTIPAKLLRMRHCAAKHWRRMPGSC